MDVDFNVDMPDWEKVTEVEARAELDRLLSDPQFHSTERNRNFLRFVAQELFEGRASTVKAYTIAVDVFGRPSSFDPTTDPIVRIEATRLRASLAQYYENRGEEGSVRIELPRGRYIPVFTKAPPQGDILEDCDDTDDLAAEPPALQRRTFLTSRRIAVVAGMACFAALSLWAASASRPIFSEKPLVAVDMKVAGDQSDIEAGLIRDYLMTALSQFHTLKLAAAETPAVVEKARNVSYGLFRTSRREVHPYQIILKYHPDSNGRSVWWQVVDPVSGEALRSGVEYAVSEKRPEAEARRELVMELANRFAGAHGVINTIEMAREMATPTLGNGCILRSVAASQRRDPNEIAEARACLTATLRAVPNDPDANAEMAIMAVESLPLNAPKAATSEALALANRAVVLAPMSDRARYAQMNALYRNGQTEAALVAGYRAMTLNPNNSLIPARLGAIFFASGDWTAGADLAARAETIDGTQEDAELILALDAYRRGDFSTALVKVQRLGHSGNYVADVLELASFGQLGNADGAKEAIERLSAYRDRFWTTFHADMNALRYAPAVIDVLSAGLTKAGLPMPQPFAATN